ncbi:hypothetical protein QTA57_17100 [Fontisubflavum oceani]|uniref:hypothetical protein n=1 Tax=Fontisubflavum oceani TaxID=2978973 RepID=UPI0025B4A822|nr:hypothetical protein [Fontisubflavum oceani]WJY21446.1 hypothetical protein QTA57_17100 [Fontisubflavum oceani]
MRLIEGALNAPFDAALGKQLDGLANFCMAAVARDGRALCIMDRGRAIDTDGERDAVSGEDIEISGVASVPFVVTAKPISGKRAFAAMQTASMVLGFNSGSPPKKWILPIPS